MNRFFWQSEWLGCEAGGLHRHRQESSPPNGGFSVSSQASGPACPRLPAFRLHPVGGYQTIRPRNIVWLWYALLSTSGTLDDHSHLRWSKSSSPGALSIGTFSTRESALIAWATLASNLLTASHQRLTANRLSAKNLFFF